MIRKTRVGWGSAARPCSHSGVRTGGSAISPAASHEATSTVRTSSGRGVAMAWASSVTQADRRDAPAWIGEAWTSTHTGPSHGPARTSAIQKILSMSKYTKTGSSVQRERCSEDDRQERFHPTPGGRAERPPVVAWSGCSNDRLRCGRIQDRDHIRPEHHVDGIDAQGRADRDIQEFECAQDDHEDP